MSIGEGSRIFLLGGPGIEEGKLQRGMGDGDDGRNARGDS